MLKKIAITFRLCGWIGFWAQLTMVFLSGLVLLIDPAISFWSIERLAVCLDAFTTIDSNIITSIYLNSYWVNNVTLHQPRTARLNRLG